ncbi:MAG TPA: TlpA disulfide reductase family protein [Pyrinomonadaceae bacterium]|jgi:thiol-disulfide isomerase/thioredoxin|nr:TlpA disulfide reductase family protein [Pyrinomonadaceae bacterium]
MIKMKHCLFTAFLLLISFAGISSAQSPLVKLEGQVVCCAECWAKADRTRVEYGTAEDLLRAKSCVAGGDPTLLAVREGDQFTLYQLEQGKFRLPGKDWLEYVGKRVAVTGAVRRKKDASTIHVDTLEVLAASLSEREAADILGQEVDLTLKDLFGVEQRLSSLRGRIVVLNFWATYCVPCRKEMPDLASIQNDYAALGVQVVGASADEAEDRSKVLQFIKETRINFPIWTGATTADMMRFGLGAALPGTVIIGKDGRIAKIISGIVNQADLKKQIDAMLASAETTTAKKREREQVGSVKEKPGGTSSVPS